VRDRLHPLAAGRKTEQPDGQTDPERDRDARADKGDQNGVVSNEIQSGGSRSRRAEVPSAPRFSTTSANNRTGKASADSIVGAAESAP
jgi:hypothetical protein